MLFDEIAVKLIEKHNTMMGIKYGDKDPNKS